MTDPLLRRNLLIGTASVAVTGLLFLYPTSRDHPAAVRRPGQAFAPAGIVTTPTTRTSGSPSPDLIINGSSAGTLYGPVQVQVEIRSGRIVRASAIDYPRSTSMDQQINSAAIPILESETVQRQSATIDMVSGATYTSDGYIRSLQSALDQAHLH